jgi:hypothetical protein
MRLGLGVEADHQIATQVVQADQRVCPRPTGTFDIQRSPGPTERGELGMQDVGIGRATSRPDALPVAIEVDGLNPASTQRRDGCRGDAQNLRLISTANHHHRQGEQRAKRCELIPQGLPDRVLGGVRHRRVTVTVASKVHDGCINSAGSHVVLSCPQVKPGGRI